MTVVETGRAPRVSVLIRCFNEVRHVGRLLEAIRGQTEGDLEVICVDSGSTDGTLDVLRRFGAKLLHVTPDEFSFGRSLNVACAAARGRFLVVASAHVYPERDDWIERLVAPLEDEDVALVYGRQRGDERTRFSEERIFRLWFPERSEDDQATPFCNNANAALRRADWERFPYDETLTGLEDLAWAKAQKDRLRRIVYRADAGVIHVHEESYGQIVRRHRREAIAMKAIFPEESFGFFEFLRLAAVTMKGDAEAANRAGRLLRELPGIVAFRFCQYLGTWLGFRQQGPVPSPIKMAFYYPRGERMHPAGEAVAEAAGEAVAEAAGEAAGEAAKEAAGKIVGPDEAAGPRRIDPVGTVDPSSAVCGEKASAPPRTPASSAPSWIDCTVPLDGRLARWPGSTALSLEARKSIAGGDGVNDGDLHMNLHCGTHVDAPRHHGFEGDAAGLPLEAMMGPCHVLDLRGHASLGLDLLDERLGEGPVERLLIRTRDETRQAAFEGGRFEEDYPYLALAAARRLVEGGLRLVGTDGPSIEAFGGDGELHRLLLGAGCVVVEGLRLQGVEGEGAGWEMLCLPLPVRGADGAPARVLIRRRS